MTALYIMAAGLVAFVLFVSLFEKRLAIPLAVIGLIALWTEFQGMAGVAAQGDARLSREPWLVISVAQLVDDEFLLSVRYAGGDIRTYDLIVTDQAEKDKFLKAQQSAKKGLRLLGKAKHPRAGLVNDGDMDFDFSEAAEIEPKP